MREMESKEVEIMIKDLVEGILNDYNKAIQEKINKELLESPSMGYAASLMNSKVEEMKEKTEKYKVVTDCLKWHEGTILTFDSKYGSLTDDNFTAHCQNAHDVKRLMEIGWIEKIEEEKDYVVIEHKVCSGGIKKVKRLSDGEIFELGQGINSFGYTIKSFLEHPKNGIIVYFNEYSLGGWSLNHIEPIPEKPVLFTTEDGKEIREGESVYVLNGNWYIRLNSICAGEELLYQIKTGSAWKTFAAFKNAKDYVIKNRPVYTLQDVEHFIESRVSLSDIAYEASKLQEEFQRKY